MFSARGGAVSTWTLIQVVMDIFWSSWLFLSSSCACRAAPKDDPRFEPAGYSFLQSKIAVLEDLSDRTETQVNQLASILDQKRRAKFQAKVQLAEQHVQSDSRFRWSAVLKWPKIFSGQNPSSRDHRAPEYPQVCTCRSACPSRP